MRRLVTAVTLFSLSFTVSLAITGTLEKGATAEHTFELEADDLKTGISVEWKDSSAVFDIALVSPTGALLQGGMTGLEVRQGPVFTRFVLCPKLPESVGWGGTWTVRLRLLDTHRNRPSVSYSFEVDGESAVKLKLDGLGGVQRAGDEVQLGVRVRSEQKGQEFQVDSCDVRVLPQGDADPIELSLSDDGSGGLFTGAFSWPSDGEYRVVVTVRGTCAEGKSFERQSLEEVQVRAAR